jgi:hypothetical protein
MKDKTVTDLMDEEIKLRLLDGYQGDGKEDTSQIETVIKPVEITSQWEKPEPLEKKIQLPDFPVDCLPKTIKDYVKAVSESTATPVDMCAIASLAVISGTVQGKYKIRGKPGYFEPLNLYALIIANPAERKSAVIRAMTKHIHKYEREENKKRQSDIDRQRIELNAKEQQIKKWENKNLVDEAIELKEECRELEEYQVKPLRLIADDVTPEALTSLLADNKGRLSVISAEGGLFDTLAGKYSNTVSIDTILKAHSGDPIRVDRRGRQTEYIPEPTLTVLLAVQENVIRGMFDNGVFIGRGLNARFLYCKPKSPIGTRAYNTNPVPEYIESNYERLLINLLELPENDEEHPYILKLSEEAYQLTESFFTLIEERLIKDLENMCDWAGKLQGAMLRISGVLHCMDIDNLYENRLVSKETVINAIEIACYFLEHAKLAYQIMGVDEEIEQAKFVLRKLELKPQKEYKTNEILLMSRNSVIKVTRDLEPILEILIEHGYLYKIKPADENRVGRKSSIIYKLNPVYFDI